MLRTILAPMIVTIIVTVFRFAPVSVKEMVCDWRPSAFWIIWIQYRIAPQLLGCDAAGHRYGWLDEGESCAWCTD